MKYIVEFEDEPCMYEDEVHFYKCIQAPWWGLSERVIEQLTPYQPDIAPDTNVGNITNLCAHENDPISRQMAIDTIMGQPPEPHYPSWYAAQIEKLPAAQPDHVADVSKKVDGDCISRKTALDALAKQMPRSYTPDGSHPADEEIYKAQEIYADCIESIEILPAVQPEIIRCKDCDWWTKQKDSLQGRCELMQMYPTGGWYCGNARRRGGDSD